MTDETRRSSPKAASHATDAPAAWIDFADTGKIRFWTSDADRVSREKEGGRDLRMFTSAELVSLAAGQSGAKMALVQVYKAGIPWVMHPRAFDAYCKRYGKQDALIGLEGRGCRGGFGTGELDMFIPGWRDELSEITRLKAEIATLREPDSSYLWIA